MKKIILLAAALLMLAAPKQTVNAQIGTWHAYMAYHDVTEVEEANNMLYVLASDNLYTYNENDQSLTTYDKVNGLSDCGIDHIGWNKAARRLMIVYKNTNIDFMDGKGNIVNLSDYYTKSMTGDKTIYSVDMNDIYAYLSTGFGIVKVNVKNAEISDTYNLGFGVDYSYLDQEYIYAASKTNGLYRAALTANLLDKSQWTRVGDYKARNKTVNADLLAKAQTLSPGGPKYNHFAFMRFHNNKLYTCGGFSAPYRPGSIQVKEGDNWIIYQDGDSIKQQTGLQYADVYCLDIDPKDDNHVFAGARNGLYEFRNRHLDHFYNSDNTPIGSAFDKIDKEYEMITGLSYDASGNLWMFNSQSKTAALIEYDGASWTAVNKPKLMTFSNGRSLANGEDLLFDSRGLLWLVNNNYTGPGLFCYQPSSDAMNSFTSFTNEDGTSVSVINVRCVAEDKKNNIWIGTNVGPLYLEPDQISAEQPIFQQYKVPRNDGTNLADYLLTGVDITCMAIDGGGRKWFGTNSNGAYLISEDNNTQIQHFLTTNSALLSNNIESIAIDPKTGEVFFGTDNGLCSYISDASATVEKMDKDNTYAYPNPVEPGYTGPITIVGLTYNADVKIVTTNGVLVAEGRSNGGTFVWDGNDRKGKRVASGVYMVETATESGESGTVCKIAIVN